ncbi:ABC transporter [Cryptosporidium sp. chipmunk genotype I]|uniref:ABC transporter n=1 Tax=Cryptosporidium sp. chipmunk genotype I TaxID=1280935 RepID=UPI00351A69BD|nr:ABC transporter [Cryptosporidium sp. chipmunk genotype I]
MSNNNDVNLVVAKFSFDDPKNSNKKSSVEIKDNGLTAGGNNLDLNSSRGGGDQSSYDAKGGSSAAAVRCSVTDHSMDMSININLGMNVSKQVTLVAKNLTVELIKRDKYFRKTVVPILKCVNFMASPGQLIGIMGPSGSGKSTLLNALSGRLKGREYNMKGSVAINGFTDIDLGYLTRMVVQEDYLLPYLTIKETMDIVAGLRLPHYSKKDREEKIIEILDIMGLRHVQDTYVGGISKKGISGGEMKRLSVALELIQNPPILFLDEPTTGLDAARAHDLLSYLSSLAHTTGIIVICSIHTPRSQTFALFDKIVLLSKGFVLGQGSPMDVVTFFNDVVTPFPDNYNPADFIIDATSLVELVHKKVISASIYVPKDATIKEIELAERNLDGEEPLYEFEKSVSRDDISMKLFGLEVPSIESLDEFHKIYEQSVYGENVKKGIDNHLRCVDTSNPQALFENYGNIDSANMKILPTQTICQKIARLSPIPGPIRFCREVKYLTKRILLNTWRDPNVTVGLLLVNTFMAIIMGGVFFSLPRAGTNDSDTAQNARNIIGLIFFVATSISFFSIKGLVVTVDERFVMNKETYSKMYTPISYYFSRMIADFPVQHIQTLVYTTIVYFMTGVYDQNLKTSLADQFGLWTVSTQAGVFLSYSFSYVLSSFSTSRNTVFQIFPLFSLVFALLAGYFVTFDQIPVWIRWLGWISTVRYTYTGMILSVFIPGERFSKVTTDFFLDQFNLWTTDIWLNVIVAICLGLAFRILGYFLTAFTLRNYKIAS